MSFKAPFNRLWAKQVFQNPYRNIKYIVLFTQHPCKYCLATIVLHIIKPIKMNNLHRISRVMELEESIAGLKKNIREVEDSIMDKWRSIKDFTTDTDYTKAERVGNVIADLKKEVGFLRKRIVSAEKELNELTKQQ